MIVQLAATDAALFRRAVQQFKGAPADETFLTAPGTLAFAAVEGATVLGWCFGYHLVRPDSSSMVYLHELEVAPEHRRRGIGRALLAAFLAASADAGASRMFLTTGAANVSARALYESLGGGLAAQGPTVSYWFRLNG